MAETYDKIGHNIDLKGFVIHKVTKEAGKRGASLKLADKAILPTDVSAHWRGYIRWQPI